MSKNWDLFVLEYARSRQQPWVDLISGMYDEGRVDLPFSFVLAQQGDRNVLVDTGFMQDERSSGFARKFGIPTWISPVRLLGELGIAAEAITDIFVTHAHFDHMGSIAEFPNAHIHIQKSELLSWYEVIALPKRYGHLTAIIDPDNLRTALEASIQHRQSFMQRCRQRIGFNAAIPPDIEHRLRGNLLVSHRGRGPLLLVLRGANDLDHVGQAARVAPQSEHGSLDRAALALGRHGSSQRQVAVVRRRTHAPVQIGVAFPDRDLRGVRQIFIGLRVVLLRLLQAVKCVLGHLNDLVRHGSLLKIAVTNSSHDAGRRP